MNEGQRVKQILKGDTASFGYFVDTYQNMALTIAYRLCRNRSDAEDVVQDAFLKAYQNLHSYKFNGKFSTWFYRIVYNTGITHINRKQNKDSQLEVDQRSETMNVQPDFFEKKEQEELRSTIEEALLQLPSNEAVIVSLYYLEDYSVKEITQIVSLSESNVKIRLFRARKKLKELINL